MTSQKPPILLPIQSWPEYWPSCQLKQALSIFGNHIALIYPGRCFVINGHVTMCCKRPMDRCQQMEMTFQEASICQPWLIGQPQL